MKEPFLGSVLLAFVTLIGLPIAFSGFSAVDGAPAAPSGELRAATDAAPGSAVEASRPRVSRRARPGTDPLAIARIYWEFNSSANDLGVHVMLDGEDWKSLDIDNPYNQRIFEVRGKQGYADFGMTELFFEGAEPSLAEVPLAVLLEKFPAGGYSFAAKTVGGGTQTATATLSHSIPAGPVVSSMTGPGNLLVISWAPVNTHPPGFPTLPMVITGYQVLVGSFQVTLPGTATSVTVPPEYVASLSAGVQPFEVLAIEASGNQSITESTFIH